MKSLRIGLIVLASLFFVACQKDDVSEKPTLPDNGAYTGTATVAPGTANELILENIEVTFTANEAGTSADIEMLKVKFAAAMPLTIDMMIPGAKLTQTNPGYAISGENIVPTYMKGTPYPERTITGLTGRATDQTLSFEMMCGTYSLSFTGTRNPK
jgi:hypothetical protein